MLFYLQPNRDIRRKIAVSAVARCYFSYLQLFNRYAAKYRRLSRLQVALFSTCNLPATEQERTETDSAEQSAKKRGAGGKVGEALTRSRTHQNAPELLQGKHSTRGAGGAQRATSRASEHTVGNHDGNKQSGEKAARTSRAPPPTEPERGDRLRTGKES